MCSGMWLWEFSVPVWLHRRYGCCVCLYVHLSGLSVCSVGGGHGADAVVISGRPRKGITSNRAMATAGPGEQEEARLLSNGSCSSSVPSDDLRVR